MRETSTYRLYVSASGEAGESAMRLLDRLEGAGFTLLWSVIGEAAYEAIGPAILSCDAVVAVVSGSWASSTYHAMEISYALGDQSYEGQPPLASPRPVFAYIEDERSIDRHWIQRELRALRIVHLPAGADDAVAVIKAVLSHARYPPSPPSIETVRSLLPIGEMPPERYVARHGHGWLAASIFSYRYPDDPEVDEFCVRVNALLRDQDKWEELRRKWLTPEEHERVRQAERSMQEEDL